MTMGKGSGLYLETSGIWDPEAEEEWRKKEKKKKGINLNEK